MLFLFISTPKSCRQKMSNTPGPPESPVGTVDIDSKQEQAMNNEVFATLTA